MENLSKHFYNSIHESILALSDIKDIVEYYGDSTECTINSYFSVFITNGKLYNSADEHSSDTYLCDVDDYESEFEEQRQSAFNDWLESEVDNIDEDDLEDVSDKVVITPVIDSVETDDEGNYDEFVSFNRITFEGRESDMEDSEFESNGDSLFEKIHALMAEASCGQNVRKAAILAGAKYVYQNINGDDYSLLFWKETPSKSNH